MELKSAVDEKLFEDLFLKATDLANSGYLAEALKVYGQAYKLNPNSYELLWNAGIINEDFGLYEAALALYNKTLSLNPDSAYLLGNTFLLRMRMCDWADYELRLEELEREIHSNKKVCPPFAASAIIDSPFLQFEVAKLYSLDCYPPRFCNFPKHKKNKKIKLAYFSADFHNHATAYLMARLFELHDRVRFELYAFSFGTNVESFYRNRLKASFDHFIDVSDKTDYEIACLSRDLHIDIAIDLKGYTRDMRAGIFAERAAPIQVNYLGFPGTMGIDYYDYIIADKILIPPECQKYYSEKIVYLPNTYQPNDPGRIKASKQVTRVEIGLPDDRFIFCCFNNCYKITPKVFDSWARILNRTPNSILWLLEENLLATKKLKSEAQKRGVKENQLLFAPKLPLADHLARLRLADLVLDTFPYNAHTTASDALLAGVPVITRLGETFASRVAASLLSAVNLPELITDSQELYEILAIELAANPIRLSQIRENLQANISSKPLFDSIMFAQHIEQAYMRMYEQYLGGIAPDTIFIE